MLTQIEEYEPTGDEDIDRDFRGQLPRRYTDLAQQHKTKAAQLAALTTTPASAPDDDPTILDDLPVGALSLADVPEELLRDLWESFNLELRYEPDARSITVRVTVQQDRVPQIRAALDRAGMPGQNGKRRPARPAAPMFVAPPTGSTKQRCHAPHNRPAPDTIAPTWADRQAVLEVHCPLPPRRNAEMFGN